MRKSAMESKEVIITCINCPIGCAVTVKRVGDDYEVSGNECKKGKKYAIQELTNPVRSITSTVKTVFSDFPRLPVKTDGEVPLQDIFIFMEQINAVVVEKRVKPGAVVLKRMKDTDVNLVATGDMAELKE
jgi:CxxC motif-containing protein